MQVQLPDAQSANEHVAPCAQASAQEPEEQLTVHVPPVGHEVLQ
jgi:hypothetical protein